LSPPNGDNLARQLSGLATDGNDSSVTQLHKPSDTEEHRYTNTLDSLLSVFSNRDITANEKALELIKQCMQHLTMENAIVGSVMGEKLDVIAVAGNFADKIAAGQQVPFSDTICSSLLERDDILAINNVDQSELSDKNSPLKNLQTYIGTQVLSENGPLGIVSFHSESARANDFSVRDKKLVAYVADWLGLILGNEEKVEFLAHQNEYYSSLFTTVPAMMMLCNEDGLILATTDRLSKTLGIESELIPGRSCLDFFPEAQYNRLSNALVSGTVNHLPLTLLCNNERTLDIEINSSIKTIGTMRGVRMVVLADVSERNQAIKAVEDQNRQLGLVNESLNQFAFVASHDLQEPLRKILQFSVFLEEDLEGLLNNDTRYHLNVISESATRMTTLIQDLLKFSKAAKGELKVEDVALSSVVADAMDELELRIAEAHANIDVGTLPIVQGDRSLIQQVITNLLSNSLKYRDKDRSPVIRIRMREEPDAVAIYLSDNGIGFNQSLAAKAFEPFNRLHTGQSYTGNGIGLSICSTVCEKHNWILSAKSEEGVGSVFTIRIPKNLSSLAPKQASA